MADTGFISRKNVIFGNMTDGLHADDVIDPEVPEIRDADTLGGKITAADFERMNENISANDFVTNVDISSYTENNPFICPTDGYLYVDGVQMTIIKGASEKSVTQTAIKTNGTTFETIFIKKGMKLYRAEYTSGNTYFKGFGH